MFLVWKTLENGMSGRLNAEGRFGSDVQMIIQIQRLNIIESHSSNYELDVLDNRYRVKFVGVS